MYENKFVSKEVFVLVWNERPTERCNKFKGGEDLLNVSYLFNPILTMMRRNWAMAYDDDPYRKASPWYEYENLSKNKIKWLRVVLK